MMYLGVVAVDDYLATNNDWGTTTYIMAAFIMFTYSLMYLGISNSVNRAFKAETKSRRLSDLIKKGV